MLGVTLTRKGNLIRSVVLSTAHECDMQTGAYAEIFIGGGQAMASAERGARTYNGGLGAELPAGSRGRAPGGGQAEDFSGLRRRKEAANLPSSCVLGT